MAVTAAETAVRHFAPMEFWLNTRTHMRKIGLIAVVAALTLVGVGGWLEWVTASSQARQRGSRTMKGKTLAQEGSGHLQLIALAAA